MRTKNKNVSKMFEEHVCKAFDRLWSAHIKTTMKENNNRNKVIIWNDFFTKVSCMSNLKFEFNFQIGHYCNSETDKYNKAKNIVCEECETVYSCIERKIYEYNKKKSCTS